MTDLREKIARAIASVHDKHEGIWRHCLPEADAVLAVLREQEPVVWMLECQTQMGDTCWQLSWERSGVHTGVRLAGSEHERPLYAAPMPASVPAGWQLVPVEPTLTMIRYAYPADNSKYVNATEIYRAMLAAAPKPEEPA